MSKFTLQIHRKIHAGVILSGAAFQAERRISREEQIRLNANCGTAKSTVEERHFERRVSELQKPGL
jgi:hypothetical protein